MLPLSPLPLLPSLPLSSLSPLSLSSISLVSILFSPSLLRPSLRPSLPPSFRGYQQQDAHEFMRYLLDKLHTELLACGSSQEEGEEGQEEGEEGEETSCDGGGGGGGGCKSTIVSQVFGGTLQSDVSPYQLFSPLSLTSLPPSPPPHPPLSLQVRCLACCTESRTHDPILGSHPPLPFPSS